MKIKRQTTAIALFQALCIFSTCALITKRLYVRDDQFEGHSCRSGDVVKTFDSNLSQIACVVSCVESGCLGVFYFPETYMCQGCYTFYSKDLQPTVSSEITVHYTPVLECPGSFVRYNTSCYMVTESLMTWNSAQDYCVSVNAHLATIEDMEENNFVSNYLDSEGIGALDDRIFFGLTDSQVQNTWLTVNDDIQSFFHWSPGEPSGSKNEDCVSINMDTAMKTWNDRPCSEVHLAVCEVELI